jgi:hypothetical protein
MNTLHLTAQEHALFSALPSSLREGWEVITETVRFADSPEKRNMRLAYMRLRDPKLHSFCQKAKMMDATQVASLMATVDLKGVPDEDLLELFFALGPDALTEAIGGMLKGLETPDQLHDLSALSFLRHSILASLTKKK